MKLLWVSNSTWSNTGYGQQSAITLPLLREMGHDIAELPYYGYAGAKSEVNGHTIYPVLQSQWGEDAVSPWAKDHGSDAVITLMDIWVLGDDFSKVKDEEFVWCPWVPIDHDPIPNSVTMRLQKADIPIAMSKFGYEQMKSVGLDPVYVPHSVDTEAYYPMPGRKAFVKETLGFPKDCFLVGMVAANKGWPSRKGFMELFEAFARFEKRVPEACLYVHTVYDERWGGPNLLKLVNTMGIDPEKVRFPLPARFIKGFDTAFMRDVYNGMDVLANPAYGEGFGLTPLEAQSCGVPTIVTNATAMPELQGSGWLVEPDRRWWTPLESFQFLPCIDGIYDALQRAYSAWGGPEGEPTSWNLKAREFALQYDTKRVIQENWVPFLKRLEGELSERNKGASQSISERIMSGVRKARGLV